MVNRVLRTAWAPRESRGVEHEVLQFFGLLSLVLFAALLYLDRHGRDLGFDFRGQVWDPAGAILRGDSPYGPPTLAYLNAHSNEMAYPPLLALLAIPLKVLPFGAALAVWDVLSFAAMALALWLVGLRDRWCFLLACASLPMAACLVLGQLSAFSALGIAVVWRYRDRPLVSGLMVGFLIALKLMAWPLVLWLLWSRRRREAAIAAASAAAFVLGSWAVIGFAGMHDYPHLLRLDAHKFETRTHSLFSLLAAVGVSSSSARAGVVAVVILVALAYVARQARGAGELSAFAVAVAVGIYASPIVHPHYVLALLVPLAAARRVPLWAWLTAGALWISPSEPPVSSWQMIVSVACSLVLVAFVITPRRRTAYSQS